MVERDREIMSDRARATVELDVCQDEHVKHQNNFL